MKTMISINIGLFIGARFLPVEKVCRRHPPCLCPFDFDIYFLMKLRLSSFALIHGCWTANLNNLVNHPLRERVIDEQTKFGYMGEPSEGLRQTITGRSTSSLWATCQMETNYGRIFKLFTVLQLQIASVKGWRCSHRNANAISVCLFPLMLLHTEASSLITFLEH